LWQLYKRGCTRVIVIAPSPPPCLREPQQIFDAFGRKREIVIATDSRRQLVILSGCSTKAPANKLPEGPIARSQKRRENGEGRIETIATTDRENIAPANWTGVAMWFCCLLGVACVLFGIDGIYTSFSQEASSVRFEWLGFGYVPLLRGTAVASVVLGGMLVRRGWSNP
jgi:hypothetical protein